MPFVWESQNYLLKLKSDNQFLVTSPFSHYFDFSSKSDPFLVTPAMKQPGKKRKTVLPIQNQHMKLIRQSEVYLMEEAVTDSIIR